MAIERVKAYFRQRGMEERIQELLVGHAVGGVCPFAVNEEGVS